MPSRQSAISIPPAPRKVHVSDKVSVYPATAARASVSAELQNSVRSIMVGTGLAVSNIQALPIVEGEEFDRVGLRMTVRGALDAVDAALLELEDHSPRVFLESVDLQPMSRARRNRKAKEQEVSATLRLASLRAVQ